MATSAYGMVATRPYVLAAVVRRAFRSVFADQADADQVIEASGLDWTILRATRLTTGPAGGPARLSAPAQRPGGPAALALTISSGAIRTRKPASIAPDIRSMSVLSACRPTSPKSCRTVLSGGL